MPNDASSTQIATGASLTVERVAHRYGSAVALEQISLHVAGGELLSLLGPSGCGKTTLLRIIGGFIEQSAGRILIEGQAVDHQPPNKRTVGIVFQNYALFPHMTVARNIAYGLEARRVPGAEVKARVAEMLALVRLSHLADRTPRELSGGQQQRVALARALAVRPSILLLDEPFAALDKNLRLDMQIEVKRIQRLSGTTTILVTHDQEEALSLSDRIAVLNQGRLEQLGTGFLVEIARMHGGSEANVDAGFQAIKALKPNIAAVAANPGQLATLYQQGQVEIGPGNFNAIQILKARGVPVEFVSPKETASSAAPSPAGRYTSA